MLTADAILHDLETLTYRTVLAHHPERTALACVRALVKCLYLNFKGHNLYVPTSDKQEQHDRYEKIWRAFNGHNHNELACAHRLSVQQIYTIINTQRAAYIRQRQHDLFAQDAEPEDSRPLLLAVMEDLLPADLQRAGLDADEARQLSANLAAHLCATYPGISIRISEAMWAKRQNSGNDDLFGLDDAEAI